MTADFADTSTANELKRMLDLREQQLADCTRAMREVSKYLCDVARMCRDDLKPARADLLDELASKLDAARAGKGEK